VICDVERRTTLGATLHIAYLAHPAAAAFFSKVTIWEN